MFKEKRINVLLFILTFMISTAAFGQSTESEAIDNYIKPFAKANHFSGVVLASKDGKVIYEKAFGFANAEHKVPNRKDTKFSVASVTKPMTSVILIRLIEAGKIGIKDKLSKYVPDFPNGDKITIEIKAYFQFICLNFSFDNSVISSAIIKASQIPLVCPIMTALLDINNAITSIILSR